MSKKGKQDKQSNKELTPEERRAKATVYLLEASGLPATDWEDKVKEIKSKGDSQAIEEYSNELLALYEKLPDYHKVEFIRIYNPESFQDMLTIPRASEFFKFQDRIWEIAERLGIPATKINPEEIEELEALIGRKEIAEVLNITEEEVDNLTEEEIEQRINKNTGLPEGEIDKLSDEFLNEFLKSPGYIAQQVYQTWGISLGVNDILNFRKIGLEEYKKTEPFLSLIKDLDKVEGLSKAKKGKLRKAINNAIDEALELIVNTPPDLPLKELGEQSVVSTTLDLEKLQEAFKREVDPLLGIGSVTIPNTPVIGPELTKNEAEKLHKQPRAYQKTVAKIVGRDTSAPSLFNMPDLEEEDKTNNLKKVISKKTAILGNLLFKLWQEKGSGPLRIQNLNSVSEQMETTNEELKICLLFLGGWVYPIIDTNEDGLTVTQEQLFHIKFKYSNKVKERFLRGEYKRIGTSQASFFKGEPVEYVEVTPSHLFIKALEGKGLGNVLVTDRFIKEALNLSDIAYKIYSFSASNKPTQRIAEDKLIEHLGLTKQVKTQGRPRVRKAIQEGLKELIEIDHLKSWEFIEERSIYSWNWGSKLVRHKDNVKKI